MPGLIKDTVPVNYIWIGPPSTRAGSSGVVGHDVCALTELWMVDVVNQNITFQLSNFH